MDYQNGQLLVNCEFLNEHLTDDEFVIVDCHWDENAYLRGHIPGAIARVGHPFVKGESNGEISRMDAMGITNNKRVVLYDEWDNHFATRLWWVMDYYGYQNVQLLDGGWQAWVTHGYPISVIPHQSKPTTLSFVPSQNPEKHISMDEVKQNLSDPSWQVLDVRTDAEFEGSDIQNTRGGHLPDAIHLEWKRMLQPDDQYPPTKVFGSVSHMLNLLDEAGLERNKGIIVHCQSGIRASLMVFCLELLGFEKVKLYDGSKAEWANLEETPLVTTITSK